MPMPACFFLKWHNRANVLCGDATVRRFRHAEVPVLHEGARTLAMKAAVLEGREEKLGLRLFERQWPWVLWRLAHGFYFD